MLIHVFFNFFTLHILLTSKKEDFRRISGERKSSERPMDESHLRLYCHVELMADDKLVKKLCISASFKYKRKRETVEEMDRWNKK